MGIEPTTSCMPCKRSSHLSYTPKVGAILPLAPGLSQAKNSPLLAVGINAIIAPKEARMTRMNKHDGGRSLVETLLVMGIAVVMGMITFRLYGDAAEKTHRMELQAKVAEIEKRVNLEWAGRGWGKGTAADHTKKLQDKGMDFSTPWGGEISLSFSEGEGGVKALARPFFGIEITNLTHARCIWAASTFSLSSICLSVNAVGSGASCMKEPVQFVTACNNSETNRVLVRYRKE